MAIVNQALFIYLVQSGGNIVSFCAETLKLNGSQPIRSTAAKVYDNCTLTAVAGLTTGPHTVAFVGTGSGRLKKLLISRSDLAEEFAEVVVDAGRAVLADLAIDNWRQLLYVSSNQKVYSLLFIAYNIIYQLREP